MSGNDGVRGVSNGPGKEVTMVNAGKGNVSYYGYAMGAGGYGVWADLPNTGFIHVVPATPGPIC